MPLSKSVLAHAFNKLKRKNKIEKEKSMKVIVTEEPVKMMTVAEYNKKQKLDQAKEKIVNAVNRKCIKCKADFIGTKTSILCEDCIQIVNSKVKDLNTKSRVFGPFGVRAP